MSEGGRTVRVSGVGVRVALEKEVRQVIVRLLGIRSIY